MSDGPLELEDEEFWTDPRRTADQVSSMLDEETEFLGILLDGPSYVSIGARTTIPLAGWYVRTLREDASIQAEDQALIAAMNLDTDDLSVGLALDTGKPRGPRGPGPSEDPGEGKVRNMFELDLRRALDLPLRPSRYHVAMILRDRLSNPVAIEIGRDRNAFSDEAVERFLAEERRTAVPPPPPAVWPPATSRDLPSYRRHPESPPLPEGTSITLSAPRVTVTSPGASCTLRGAFRLPAQDHHRVRSSPDGSRPDVGDQAATAVIPITLLFTGSEVVGPFVYRLQVPVHDPIPPDATAPLVTGHFNLDLFALPDAPTAPMTYFLYALSQQTIVGPTPIGIVSPEMLPVGRS